MPEHTSLLHYLLSRWDALRDNTHVVGTSLQGHHVAYRDLEPLFMAALLMLVILYLLTEVRGTFKRLREAAVPEQELTLRTFFELFFEYFYNLSKDVMGAKNAKRYFPLIGASAIFIFLSNAIGLIPGMLPPTACLNITLGCALLVFVSFNYYGIKENGLGYFKHMAGWGVFKNPVASAALAILLFPIEFISMSVRPITLSVRLMLNIAVDHMLASIMLGLFALLLPIPLMLLGIIVICVQTLVFCLLTAIYIGLATEHAEEHH